MSPEIPRLVSFLFLVMLLGHLGSSEPGGTDDPDGRGDGSVEAQAPATNRLTEPPDAQRPGTTRTAEQPDAGPAVESGPDLPTPEAAMEAWREALTNLDADLMLSILVSLPEGRRGRMEGAFARFREEGTRIVQVDYGVPERVSEFTCEVMITWTVHDDGVEYTEPPRPITFDREGSQWRVDPPIPRTWRERLEWDLRVLKDGAQFYELDTERFPRTVTDLARDPGVDGWNGPYVEGGVPTDPFGNQYRIVTGDDLAFGFDIISYGADGQPGGDGVNGDTRMSDVISNRRGRR